AFFRRRIRKRRADVDRVVGADEDGTRLAELRPRRDERPVLIEHLDAVVLAIGDVEPAAGAANKQIVRLVELPGCVAEASPLLDEPSVLRELHDASRAELVRCVPVGDEDAAVARDGDAGRSIEPLGAPRRDASLAERHEHASLRAQLQDLLAELRIAVADIRHPEVAVRVHGETVRVVEQPVAETPDHPARRVELQDRRVGRTAVDAGCGALGDDIETAMEDPDAVAIDVDSDHLAPLAAVHRRRQLRPSIDEPVRIGQLARRRIFLLLGPGDRKSGDDRGGGRHSTMICPYAHGCSLQMYVYVPGLSNVTPPTSPVWSGPVVHDPSCATIVWIMRPLLRHVTGVPAFTLAR